MKYVTGAILALAGTLLLAGRSLEADREQTPAHGGASPGPLAEVFALPEGHPPIEGWAPALPEGHPPVPDMGPGCPRNSLGAAPGFDDEVYIVAQPAKVIST
jgi:hypothetical protein